MDETRLYGGFFIAMRDYMAYVSAFVVMARSREEANGKLIELAKEVYPASKGFHGHSANSVIADRQSLLPPLAR